jgi:hypothetical protein
MSGMTAEASPNTTDWDEATTGFAMAALFCVIALGLSWVVGRMLYEGHRTRDWVSAQATVNGFGERTVAYDYVFGGVRYFGNRVDANPIYVRGNVDMSQDGLDAMLASAYQRGEPITVRVNPDDPAESMVNTDVPWKLVILMAPLAVACGGLGLVFLWVTLRRISGTSEYGHDERSATVTWIITLVLTSLAVPVAILFLHEALSKRSLEAAMYGVATLLAGASAIRSAMAASARTRERGPTDPMEVRAGLLRLRQARARLAVNERKELRSFLIMFGLIALFLLGLCLAMWIIGPGHA